MKRKMLTLMGLSAALLTIGCKTANPLPRGAFHSLSELVKEGKLSTDSVLNISYWQNQGKVYDAEGKEISVDPSKIQKKKELSVELSEMICTSYYEALDPSKKEKWSLDQIKIELYCGFYEGYHALRFADLEILATVTGKEVVGGYTFHYGYADGNRVVLWSE